MKEGSGRGRGGKTVIYVVAAFVVVVLGMYLWKQIAVGREGRATKVEREQLVAAHEEMEQQLRAEFADQASELIKMLGTPLGWAIRTEAIQEDYAQIEEYLVQLVKEPDIRRLVYVLNDGTIKVTTDKKLQGEPATQFFGELWSGDQVAIAAGEKELQLIVPIMGYNSRLGSLIVTISNEILVPQVAAGS